MKNDPKVRCIQPGVLHTVSLHIPAEKDRAGNIISTEVDLITHVMRELPRLGADAPAWVLYVGSPSRALVGERFVRKGTAVAVARQLLFAAHGKRQSRIAEQRYAKEHPRFPEAEAWLAPGNIWRVPVCPLCGNTHEHGAGGGEYPPEKLLGHRSAHCIDPDVRAKGYYLVSTQLDLVKAVTERDSEQFLRLL